MTGGCWIEDAKGNRVPGRAVKRPDGTVVIEPVSKTPAASTEA